MGPLTSWKVRFRFLDCFSAFEICFFGTGGSQWPVKEGQLAVRSGGRMAGKQWFLSLGALTRRFPGRAQREGVVDEDGEDEWRHRAVPDGWQIKAGVDWLSPTLLVLKSGSRSTKHSSYILLLLSKPAKLGLYIYVGLHIPR